MEIRQLLYFLELARTEHLTQSAGNLFVTQSTLSHGLRQLEEELNVQLFDRLGRGLRLSHAGQEFKSFAARALQEIEAGRMALSDLSGLKSGRLTVGSIPTFLNTVVPPAAAAFSRAYPGVHVQILDLRAGPIETQIVNGELDLGIAFLPTEHGDIETEALFDERMVLAVRPDHPLARRPDVKLADLAGIPLALLPRSFATRRMIDEGFRAARVNPVVRMEVASVEALLGVCRHGDLATIAPDRAASQASDLTRIPLTRPEMVRHAAVLWRRGASRSAAAREFAALLRLFPSSHHES